MMSKYLLNCSLKRIIKNNDKYIFTEKNTNLYSEVNSHPDMLCVNLGEVSIMEPETYWKLKDRVKNLRCLSGDKKLNSKYPFDILYNCCKIGDKLFGKINYLDDKILEYCKKEKIRLIDVNQGYTKCSILKLNDEAVITSDISIYNKLTEFSDIKSLYVNNSGIYLSDRYTGFIGGASGVIDDTCYFFGDYKKIQNHEVIEEFILSEGLKIKNFIPNEKKLYDLGGIVRL